MATEITTEAPTIEEAIDAALEELGVQQDVVDYEVVHDPNKGFFGRGSDKPAQVRVWIKDAFAAEIEAARSIARDMIEDGDETDAGGEDPSEPVAEADADEDAGESAEAEADDTDVNVAEDAEASIEDAQDAGATDRDGDGPARGELSDEELDAVADAGIEAINGLLERLGVEARIDEYEGDDGEIILDIVGEDLGILIGRHGKTLDALQAIVSTLVRRKLGWYYPVLVDVEGYRSRRRSKLEGIARNAADRAARQGRPVRLRPMNSYERKVVHIALRNSRDVTTESEGDEPNRAVVVIPK